MGSFIKGTVIGMVAGASLGMMISPRTRRKFMKGSNRVFRVIENTIDNVRP